MIIKTIKVKERYYQTTLPLSDAVDRIKAAYLAYMTTDGERIEYHHFLVSELLALEGIVWMCPDSEVSI